MTVVTQHGAAFDDTQRSAVPVWLWSSGARGESAVGGIADPMVSDQVRAGANLVTKKVDSPNESWTILLRPVYTLKRKFNVRITIS